MNRWQIWSPMKIVSDHCKQIYHYFSVALQYHDFCNSIDFTGPDLYWKGKIVEARTEHKRRKEADKKEKEQKRAEEMASKNKRAKGKRQIQNRTCFTVEDDRIKKAQRKKVRNLHEFTKTPISRCFLIADNLIFCDALYYDL